MELREAMARQLMQILYAPVVMDFDKFDATRRRCFEIADECIRQMRWAEEKHGGCSVCGPPPYLCNTPAPPEWKPRWSTEDE